MKDIKDYLHFYFGQVCSIKWTNECCENTGLEDGLFRIDGTVMDNISGIESCFIYELRPLSSMTEEEAIEIYDTLFPNSTILKTTKYNCIVSQLDRHGIYHEGNVCIQDYADWFPILLYKGFDLFGLIESGLAIENPLKR